MIEHSVLLFQELQEYGLFLFDYKASWFLCGPVGAFHPLCKGLRLPELVYGIAVF